MNHRGIAYLFIILVLAIGGIGVAYYNATQRNAQLLTSLVTPTPVADPTANWKTYNFPEINMSFKAPEDLTVSGESVNEGSFLMYIQNNKTNVDEYYQLYVVAQWEPKHKETELDELKQELNPDSISEVTVQGNKGIRGQVKGERNRYVTYFIKGDTLYSAFTAQPTKQNEALSNQILTTFEEMQAAP